MGPAEISAHSVTVAISCSRIQCEFMSWHAQSSLRQSLQLSVFTIVPSTCRCRSSSHAVSPFSFAVCEVCIRCEVSLEGSDDCVAEPLACQDNEIHGKMAAACAGMQPVTVCAIFCWKAVIVGPEGCSPAWASWQKCHFCNRSRWSTYQLWFHI